MSMSGRLCRMLTPVCINNMSIDFAVRVCQSLSVFLGDTESAFTNTMRQEAEDENLTSLKEALPINVRCTVRMFEECDGDQCSYVLSGEDPPYGRCDCYDRKWRRHPGNPMQLVFSLIIQINMQPSLHTVCLHEPFR